MMSRLLGALGLTALHALLTLPLTFASEVGSVPQLPLGLPQIVTTTNDDNKIALGRFLFRSTALSSDNTISCASCHNEKRGFSGNGALAVGVHHFVTRRHPPVLFNLYLSKLFMADGRASSLEDQLLLPLESREMEVDWTLARARLSADSAALELARAAGLFTFDRSTILSAIADFVSNLVSGNSRFDRYFYAGDRTALTPTEQNGLRTFIHKARCSTCHLLDGNAAPLTDGNFHSIGVGYLNGKYQDLGRSEVTGDPRDEGAFKTPTLRNVSLRSNFMHDGSMTTLDEVIRFYNNGGEKGAPNLDPRIRRLYLSEDEISDLISFLRSLTSDVSLLRTSRQSSYISDSAHGQR